MSSIVAAINKKLVDLAITPDVYNEMAEQNPDYPLTVFDYIDEAGFGRSHDTGVMPFREGRFQVDVYALSIKDAEDAIEAYIQALGHFDGLITVTAVSPEIVFDTSIRFANRNPGSSYRDEAALKEVIKRSVDFIVVYN
jgi:hypothetical protein